MKCPFAHLGASPPTSEQADDLDSGSKKAGGGGCPHAARAAVQAVDTSNLPAACPLGFSSSQRPKLGQFQCPLCRCLYYDCVTTNCGHRYCAACIAPFRDCPTCGADIASMAADEDTQALVEEYIDAHAGKHSIWELETAGRNGGSASDSSSASAADGVVAGQQLPALPAGEDRSRASFLLQLGLRALAAGNTESALHRLSQSAEDLARQLAEAGRTPGGEGPSATVGGATSAAAPQLETSSLRCRLGTVYGVMGDCCRRGRNASGALRHYHASLRQLEQAGGGAEALEARAVSLSKAGEVHHLSGDVEEAAQLYRSALELRRQVLVAGGVSAQAMAASASGRGPGPSSGSEAEVNGITSRPDAQIAAVLQLVGSLVKLADVEQSMAGGAGGGALDSQPSAQLLQEAAELLEGVRGGIASQSAAMRRKFAALASYCNPGMLPVTASGGARTLIGAQMVEQEHTSVALLPL